MKLILVHGRAQEGKDPVALKKTWVDTLKKGLAKSNLQLPISENDIIFPYYGDTLDSLVNQINEPMEGVIAKGNSPTNKDAEFFHDFLKNIADNAKITDEVIAEQNKAEIIQKGPLNWEWVQAILKTLDSKTPWGNTTLKAFTYDVFMYLTVDGIRKTIDKIVKQKINNQPCVVVGHSLGSVVAYNVLRNNPSLNVVKYITVGSPLGLTSIKNHLATPLSMPDCVKRGWFNAFDDRDVVALNPLDNKHFNINPAIQNKSDVRNQTANRHGIEGYLNDKVIARMIYDNLA